MTLESSGPVDSVRELENKSPLPYDKHQPITEKKGFQQGSQ